MHTLNIIDTHLVAADIKIQYSERVFVPGNVNGPPEIVSTIKFRFPFAVTFHTSALSSQIITGSESTV